MTTRFALAATLLLLSACAGGSGAGSGLVGRTFLSTEVTGHTLVADTRLDLAFPESGKLTVHAGCNQLFGDVSFDGGHLKVSELGSTDMGCDEARNNQDNWVAAFLRAGPTFALKGDELVLAGGAEVIRFVDRKAAQPDQPLQGTPWVVESLLDGQSAGSVPAGAQAFLQFGGDTVTGNTGCNQLSGKAVHGPATITFADVVTTKKACAQGRAALEAAVLATLNGQVTTKIDSDRLELRTANGRGLQLRAADQPPSPSN
jgi:heat shock protein HslJ